VTALVAALVLVTNAEYRECVKAGACKPPAFEDPHSAATGKSENAAAYARASQDSHAAVGVSWNDARDYCSWKGLRLASLEDVRGKRVRGAIWLADADGKKRLILEAGSQRAEDPWARAPWLSFRCSD
jgi:hypothetical protein